MVYSKVKILKQNSGYSADIICRCSLTVMTLTLRWPAPCRGSSVVQRHQGDHDVEAAEWDSASAAGWSDQRWRVQGAAAPLQCKSFKIRLLAVKTLTSCHLMSVCLLNIPQPIMSVEWHCAHFPGCFSERWWLQGATFSAHPQRDVPGSHCPEGCQGL